MVDEKELLNLAFEAVELAKKSGKIRKGSNEVTKAVEKGIAKLVVVAKDVNPPEIIMHLKPLCEEKGALFVQTGTKDDLGAAAGLPVATATVAIVQEGDAASVIKQLEKVLKSTKSEEKSEPEEKSEEKNESKEEPEEKSAPKEE